MLEKQDPELVKLLDQRFEELDAELDQYQKDDGSWTFYDELTKAQIKSSCDAVAALERADLEGRRGRRRVEVTESA